MWARRLHCKSVFAQKHNVEVNLRKILLLFLGLSNPEKDVILYQLVQNLVRPCGALLLGLHRGVSGPVNMGLILLKPIEPKDNFNPKNSVTGYRRVLVRVHIVMVKRTSCGRQEACVHQPRWSCGHRRGRDVVLKSVWNNCWWEFNWLLCLGGQEWRGRAGGKDNSSIYCWSGLAQI